MAEQRGGVGRRVTVFLAEKRGGPSKFGGGCGDRTAELLTRVQGQECGQQGCRLSD